jgi:hypothetical protein
MGNGNPRCSKFDSWGESTLLHRRPVARAERSTLPGASAQRRLLVKGTHTTLLIRLRFSAFLELLEPACESRDRNRLDLEGSPNTHGPGRLPFDAFECSSCRCCNGWIRVRVHRFTDSIHCLGYGFRVVPCDIFCYSLRVNLAS